MKKTVISETSENRACLCITTRKLEEFSHTSSFNELLLKAVDTALFSLIGSTKERIYHYLEETASIRKEEIPNEIDRFAKAIEKIFGCGAYLVEIEIMKKLYRKLGNDAEYWPEKSKLVFREYVDAIRLSNKTKENMMQKP